MNSRRRLLPTLISGLAILVAGSLPLPMRAQEGELVDRIVAVVGDSAITLSQLQERILQLRYQQIQIPDPGTDAYTQLQRDLLDQMIGEQLIVQAALKDTTITVDEADLDETVNGELQEMTRNFGSQTAFQQALAEEGWTAATYREFRRGQARQQRLYSLYLTKRARDLTGIPVESSEIEAFFEAQRDLIGQRPPTVIFKQVVVTPSPSDSSLEAARAEAERIRQLAVEGEDFEELARRFSQDPGSAANGGDVGWFRRGSGFVEAFEEAAFELPPGAISQVVQTEFGFHIIQVDRRRSGEVRARHILITPELTPADQERARQRAVQAKERLEQGVAIEEIVTEYGDPEAPDSLAVPFDQLQGLPPGFAEPLLQSEPGQIIGPIEYQTRPGRSNLAVIEVLDVQEGRPWSLEDADLRAQIRQRLQQEKLQERILDELRAKTYVEIRM